MKKKALAFTLIFALSAVLVARPGLTAVFTVTGDGVYSDVSATVAYQLDNDQLIFKVTNTSESRLTAFAFNSDASVSSLSLSDSWYFYPDERKNFKIPDDRGIFDYGASINNNAWAGGAGNDAALKKDDSQTFIFDIKGDDFTEENILKFNENGFLFVARFQSIEGLTDGVSDSTTAAYVPIPAAGWLFASGLLGLLVLRRRQLSN